MVISVEKIYKKKGIMLETLKKLNALLQIDQKKK